MFYVLQNNSTQTELDSSFKVQEKMFNILIASSAPILKKLSIVVGTVNGGSGAKPSDALGSLRFCKPKFQVSKFLD